MFSKETMFSIDAVKSADKPNTDWSAIRDDQVVITEVVDMKDFVEDNRNMTLRSAGPNFMIKMHLISPRSTWKKAARWVVMNELDIPELDICYFNETVDVTGNDGKMHTVKNKAFTIICEIPGTMTLSEIKEKGIACMKMIAGIRQSAQSKVPADKHLDVQAFLYGGTSPSNGSVFNHTTKGITITMKFLLADVPK